MYAILQHGGHQYRVASGDRILVDRIPVEVGSVVTLPPVLEYQSTIQPFAGNASEESLIQPVKGAYIVFWGGFELPPQTTLGPGTLTIQFIAQCITAPSKGVYTVQVSVTDAARDHVEIDNVAPLNVFSS